MKNKKRWWQRRQSPSRFYSPIETNHRGGEVDDRTFGNIWTRIWRNRDADGRVYYSFTQHRLYEKYGQVKLARSFFSEDPDDVCSGALWAREEIRKRETQQLSVWQQDRNRSSVVRHTKQVELLKRKHGRRPK